MERAGTEDMPEDKVNCSAGAREGGLGHAERKGLGTPATRAAILEKLVQMGFVQRKGKQLVPTKDGINLAVVLPESLTSPALTAEWENRLTEIAKGNADPDEFMAEIEAQVCQLVKPILVSVQISKTCSSRNGLLSASVQGAVKTSMRARKTSTAEIVAVSS